MKYIILYIALCGSLSFCSTPSKSERNKIESESSTGFEFTEFEIYEHDEFGGANHAKLIRTVTTPVNVDQSPKSSIINTPQNSPADTQQNSPQISPREETTNTQSNKIEPTPATTPHRILRTSNSLEKLEFELNRMRVAACAASQALPNHGHVRVKSGPTEIAQIVAETAKAAAVYVKANVESQSKSNN